MATSHTSATAAVAPRGPGVTSQLLSFVALVIIQGSHVLFFKLSQKGGKYAYNTASAIALTEAFKFFVSAGLCVGTRPHKPESYHLSMNAAGCYTLLALSYCVNNQLTFWLLADLGPGQLSLGKSIVPMLTAGLLWAVYDDKINSLQWACILLTVAGLLNVLRADSSVNSTTPLLVVSCLITAFSSVVNARLLQKSTTIIHVQNMLLYSMGFMMNLVAYFVNFTPSAQKIGFFEGFDNGFVWGVLVSQSLMGIAITFVYKYGGAIVKTLASAVQGALLFMVDVLVFGVTPSIASLSGAFVTLTASYIYFAHALRMPPTRSFFTRPISLALRGTTLSACIVTFTVMCALFAKAKYHQMTQVADPTFAEHIKTSFSLSPSTSNFLSPSLSSSLSVSSSVSISSSISATPSLTPPSPSPSPFISQVALLTSLPPDPPRAFTARVAILLGGLTRTFAQVWPRIKPLIIDTNEDILFDIFIHTSIEPNKPWPANNKEALSQALMNVYQDSSRGVRVMSITITEPWGPQSNFPETAWVSGCQSQNHYISLRHQYADQARRLAEANLGLHYNRTLHLRPDVFFTKQVFLIRDWWNTNTLYFFLGDWERRYAFLLRDWDFAQFGEPHVMDIWQHEWMYKPCVLNWNLYAEVAQMPASFPKHCVSSTRCIPMLPDGFDGVELWNPDYENNPEMPMDGSMIVRAWQRGVTLDAATSRNSYTFLNIQH
eukprot:c10682_g1_i1.p1 GENE.c10682_g1_i1~~c10682_g1_i1.p1  ORF type:complete len:784 (-),score=157.30 c10682_g1_i1:177-2327(-)